MPLSKPSLSTFYSEGKPTTAGWIAAGIGAVGLVAVIAGAVLLISALRVDVPLPDNAPGGQATEVLDAQGNLIGALKGEQKRQIVELAEMAPTLREAVVATEDRQFYEHSGLSFRGMVRALFTNTWAGEVEQGGSTITQQYARNAFGRIGTERTVSRKVKEIVVARKIENRYSKDKILEFYLNTIYFGRGAYGAEAAALTYFKKPAKDLTLDEAAFLAGIIRSPEYFQPEEHAQDAVRIRNEVLGDMVAAGYLSQDEADEAKQADLLAKFKLGPTHLDSPRAGFFMEHVRRLLRSDQHGFSDAELLGGGLTIHTSLDLHMQDAAEAAVSEVLPEPNDPEVALIAMDPDGFVRAMVGGRDVKDRVRALGFNFAANVRQEQEGGRPAGSAFKPIALAKYLEEGGDLSDRFRGPRQITIDSPLCRGADGEPWTVSNYGNQGYGRLNLTQATTNSVNTVYAQIMADGVSPKEFMATAEDLGVSIPSRDEGCALTLGTTPVTPLELATAYTTFAARGQRPDPLVVIRVTGPGGETLLEREPRSRPVLGRNVADTINHVLQRVITGGTGQAARIGRPAAGKTGTTQNYRDAWFAGYTPDLTAVVWMGYAPDESGQIAEMTDVQGRQVTGGSFPAMIWRNFMQEALKGTKPSDFAEPQEFTSRSTPGSKPTCPPNMVQSPNGGCAPIDLPSLLPEPGPLSPGSTGTLPPAGTPGPPPMSPLPSPTASPVPTTSPSPMPSPSPSPSPDPSLGPGAQPPASPAGQAGRKVSN